MLGEEGRDGLAGAAPGGVGLEGDVGRGFDEFVELGFGGDVDDGGHFGYWVVGLVGDGKSKRMDAFLVVCWWRCGRGKRLVW